MLLPGIYVKETLMQIHGTGRRHALLWRWRAGGHLGDCHPVSELLTGSHAHCGVLCNWWMQRSWVSTQQLAEVDLNIGRSRMNGRAQYRYTNYLMRFQE